MNLNRRLTSLFHINKRYLSTNQKQIPPLMDKILIANRGEIACRVIKTCQRLGVKTVAVYSDADAHSQHVKLADESVYIGASPATESYLQGERIINAAIKTGAKGIHPGYGFLSENLEFSQLCLDKGVTFIGPPPEAIRAMASKSESKDIMIKANVPVTPGYHGDDQNDDVLWEEAQKIGFPIMLKAVLGGGGKGMRAVGLNNTTNSKVTKEEFIEALESCRREAMKSFKDDVILLEKLVQEPRHVELQVFADNHGNVVHLLERDCSVQRRHQKVLEEAPASYLPDQVRKMMGEAAVACAKAVNYRGAGTVEFLLDSVTNDFYFCEMNTRLQVEHPVTEMITGVDLVEWQLKVASNQEIPLQQDEIINRVAGHAVEARIYAENPQKGFLPATGTINYMSSSDNYWNTNNIVKGHSDGDGSSSNNSNNNIIRLDTGITQGDGISTFYDPMIAKLIVHSSDRASAIELMKKALNDYHISGLSNNIDFLVYCCNHDGFKNNNPTTAFFEHYLDNILSSMEQTDDKYWLHKAAAALVETIVDYDHHGLGLDAQTQIATGANSTGSSPWTLESLNNFRNACHAKQSIKIISPSSGSNDNEEGHVDEEIQVHKYKNKAMVGLDDSSDPQWSFTNINCIPTFATNTSRSVEVKCRLSSSSSSSSVPIKITVVKTALHPVDGSPVSMNNNNGFNVDVWISSDDTSSVTTPDTHLSHASFTLPSIYESGDTSSSKPLLLAPMPGKIIKVTKSPGDVVKQGDILLILEAMKMEHAVAAPCDGNVNYFFNEGDTIGEGAKLAEIHSEED